MGEAPQPSMYRCGCPRKQDAPLEAGDALVDAKKVSATRDTDLMIWQTLPSSDNNDAPFERWRTVDDWLGSGGQGRIYLEQLVNDDDPSAGRLRAVKVLKWKEAGIKTAKHMPEILGMARFSVVTNSLDCRTLSY